MTRKLSKKMKSLHLKDKGRELSFENVHRLLKFPKQGDQHTEYKQAGTKGCVKCHTGKKGGGKFYGISLFTVIKGGIICWLLS